MKYRLIQPVLTWHAFSIGEAAKASFSSSVSSIHDFIIILSIILLNKAPSSWTIAHPVSYFDTHTLSLTSFFLVSMLQLRLFLPDTRYIQILLQ